MKRKKIVPRGKRLTARSLVQLVGSETAMLLMNAWGGHRVPGAFHVKRIERDVRINRALDNGATGSELASRESLTPQRIYQIGKNAD